MWVFCCGMYRSASTLQFQITTRVIKDAGRGQQVGWIDANRFLEVRDSYANYTGLKVVKVHRFTEPIGWEFTQNKAMGIYTFRDMRDIYASMMQQQQKSFTDIWNWQGRDFIETCLENYKKWTELPEVIISNYEEILQNIPREVKRIAQHLNIDIHLSECQKIAADYSLEMQQERIKQFRDKLLQMQRHPDDHREIVDYHDEDSLLHMNHIDAVKSGRWIEDLSAEEVALIENKIKDWCRFNKYEPSTFLYLNKVA